MTVFRVFTVLALVASALACAENVPPPPGGGSGGLPGGGGTGATGGTGAAGGSGGSGGTGGIGGVGGTGACLSESDLDAITDLYPTSARQIAAQCGIDCASAVGDQAFLDCTNPCIDDDDGVPGLSPDCGSCYGDFALCIRFTCLNQCALDPCGPSCESCPGYDPCFEALSQCAGRDSRDCVP